MRPLKILIFVLLAALAPAVAAAETVRVVEFRGLVGLAEETLRFYLGIEEGRELDEAALNRALHELWQRRLVDDIRVDKEPVADGIKVVVTVAERPILRSIDYAGIKRISVTVTRGGCVTANRTAAAMSVVRSMSLRRVKPGCASGFTLSHMAVSTGPGEISVVRTPVPASSAVNTSCSPRSPNLLAPYAAFPGNHAWSEMLPMVTT